MEDDDLKKANAFIFFAVSDVEIIYPILLQIFFRCHCF